MGERGLEIERNILNAEAERALSGMMDGRISYIDHSNLADRGFIIKDYYRPDELHLSKDGIYQYTGNLKEAIHKALHEKQGTSYDTKRQKNEPQTGRNRNRSISIEGRYRRDSEGDHYERDRNAMEYTRREQRPRGYQRSKNGSYGEGRQHKSYNYHYDDTQSYDRRAR